MEKNYSIKKAKNGYVLEVPNIYDRAELYVCPTLQGVLDKLAKRALQQFEGRAEVFHGDSYGSVTVTVNYEEPEEHNVAVKK